MRAEQSNERGVGEWVTDNVTKAIDCVHSGQVVPLETGREIIEFRG